MAGFGIRGCCLNLKAGEAMKLVVLVEERSTKIVLDTLLPRILPHDIFPQVIPFNGIGDLENGITNKLRNWNEPNVKFAIVEDQDNDDCIHRKANVSRLVEKSGKPALVRIACRELEAWYFGDLKAVESAYNMPGLAKRYASKKKYRNPDEIVNPKEEFLKIIPTHQQIHGAQLIAPHMEISRNRSVSFQTMVSGFQKWCQ